MRLLILNICLAFSISAVAQVHSIGLEESRTAALSYSKTIKNGQLNVQSAEVGLRTAETNRYPSVSLTGVMLQGFKDFVDPIPNFLEKGISNFYFAGATAMQPIYAGGKIKTGIELSRLALEVQKIRAQQSDDSVLLMTEKKYWDIVKLQEQRKTLEANEVLLNAILKQQKDLLASGLIARNDLLKVKVKLSQLLLDKSKLENGRKVALYDFSLYIGIPYDSLLVAKDTLGRPLPPDATFVPADEALAQNSDYHLLKKNTEAEKMQTKMTKADYLPSVSAGVSAAQIGSIGNNGINKFMPMALGTVSIPLSGMLWGDGKQKMIQRKISENIAQNNLEDGERQIKTGILKNWYDVTDAYKQISFSEENMDAASENMKVNRDNYGSGLASITEVLDAQAAYQLAASDRVSAYATYRQKMADYKYIIGKIK